MQAVPLDSNGKAPVHEVLATQPPASGVMRVMVVAEDLTAPGCASLFGYADPRNGLAVVSTFRLSEDDDALLQERISKVIAHEWMHLRGRRHCRQPDCLMHPVSSVEALDARGQSLCPRCRRVLPWKGALVAALAAIPLFLALDIGVDMLQTKSRPFTWRERETEAQLLYQGEELLRLPAAGQNHSPHTRARELAAQLNRYFVEIDPPALVVQESSTGAAVWAADSPLLLVDASVAGDRPPAEFARDWVARVTPLLEGKGRAGESCPQCHIARREQIRWTVAHPPRFWH
jgi:hypothetical protein